MSKKTVVIGVSGGIDSSVSAYLLKESGYHVVGLFMKNWEETNTAGECHAARDYEDALSVCQKLGIPCYSVNFSAEYQNRVFDHFLSELRLGRTPNPDILCNREIKFKTLMDKALDLGADFLATGHYCRTQTNGALTQLRMGLDPNKDQSYFPSAVPGAALERTLFPIGDLMKSQVRSLARELGLPNSEKKESMGICFIGKRNFKEFVSLYLGYQPGDIVTLEGKILGRHQGVAYHTIGQRHGLGIGGPGEPWFVVDKRVETGEIVVAQGGDHPALFARSASIDTLTWINDPPTSEISLTAKARYRQKDQPCSLTIAEGGSARVDFQEPQKAITPGQSIVFYQGEICLGGGVVRSRS